MEDGVFPATGDYAVDTVFTPENTGHLATTGAIYEAIKNSIGLQDLQDNSEVQLTVGVGMLRLPIPRTPAVVNIEIDYAGDDPDGWDIPTAKGWGTSDCADGNLQSAIAGTLEYFDRDGNYFKKNVKLSQQGGISSDAPQSNIRIDFTYNNSGKEIIQFGDWVPQDCFHLKAYYIDVFRGVSIVGYRLAEQAIQQENCRTNRFVQTTPNTTEFNLLEL